MRKLFEILYVSDLAGDQPSTVVGEILTAARTANQLHHITGLLVFDGQHFMQLIEGDEIAVKQLMQNIEQDSRHANLLSLHEGRCGQRRFSRFSMGYSYSESGDAVVALRDLRGENAITAFLRAVPSFDLDG